MSGYIYNIPTSINLSKNWNKVILRSSSPSELVNAFHEIRKTGGIQVEGLLLTYYQTADNNRFDIDSQIGIFEHLPPGMPVTIEINKDEVKQLFLWRRLLFNLRTTIKINADFSITEAIQRATDMGYQVLIDPYIFTDDKYSEEMSKIIDFYFHTPDLTIPVEPVHTLYQTWIKCSGPDLWDIFKENPVYFRYITTTGQVTLSERWADNTFFIRSRKPGSKIIPVSSLYNYKKDIFKNKSQCSGCSAFRICGGITKIGPDDLSCRAICEMSSIFEEKTREISRIIEG